MNWPKYRYIPSLLSLPATHPPSHPSRLFQSNRLSSLLYGSFPLAILHSVVNIRQCYNLLPLCAHKSPLCVCIFIPALQTGTSFYHFSRLHIYALIPIFVFLFLTELCITGSCYSLFSFIGQGNKWGG